MQFFILSLVVCLAKKSTAEFFYKPSPTEYFIGKPKNVKLPWMGVLRVRQTPPLMDAVANVILIAKEFALSNANEIHDLDILTMKNTTYVNFYSDKNTLWKCYVEEFILHPEFKTGKLNTIGLIHLGTEQKLLGFLWKPVLWPKTYFNTKDVLSIFTVGFTDQRRTLEQVVYKMDTVDFINCTDTYIKEGLSFPTIWPKYYTCFRAKEHLDTCLYDAGMAAASNATGEWTLIGISIYGPGCSFPARFIEFYPYIPWIQGVLKTILPKEMQYTRRAQPFAFEYYEDLDADIIKNLDNASIVMDTTETNVELDVWGKCHNKTYKIYAEEGYIRLRQSLEITTALYSVTIALRHLKLICIKTLVKCKRKSKTQVFMREGFGQEDLHFYIQHVPEYKIGTKQYADRILFMKGGYLNMAKIPTVTIWFKFEVVTTAGIQIAFYGEHEPPAVVRTRRPRPRYSTRKYKSYNRRKMANQLGNTIQQEYYEPEMQETSFRK